MCVPSKRHTPGFRQQGLGLLELVAALLILSLVLTGMISLFGTAIRHGAEPPLRLQSLVAAEAYMNEILGHPYPAGVCPAPGAARPALLHACEYHALPVNGCSVTTAQCPVLGQCLCDRSGQPIAGLRGFSVDIRVEPATVSGVSGLGVMVIVAHEALQGETARLWALRTPDGG